MKKLHHDSRIILASKSPRRRTLLQQAGLAFSVFASDFEEHSVAMSDPDCYVKSLAEGKAVDVSTRFPDSWVIGADTIVRIEDTILGKPVSEDIARSMLGQLSGRAHQVLTGYCISCAAKKRVFTETVTTDVVFKPLRPEEIEWYIQTGEPFDKAGAYAIQGIGSSLVKRINGSYTNVVGLPVCEVMTFLMDEGVITLR